MKKILQNKNLLKYCTVLVIAVVLAIVSIVYFVQSYSFYKDEWGTDISFDTDSIVFFLSAIPLGIYGGYGLYAEEKGKDMNMVFYSCFMIVFVLLSFYPLGMFFKGLAKGKAYTEIQSYLYMGILSLVVLVYLGFSYWLDKKE